MNEFESRLAAVDPTALCATTIEVLQVNLGLRCNLRCSHCHQSSSPERAEVMSDHTFGAVLELARAVRPALVDLTGGAPELHPRFREHVLELRRADLEVQVRTNLTLLLEPAHRDLPGLWAAQRVRLLASLPSSDPGPCERQRGPDVFGRCIGALRALNAVGYAGEGGPTLDLAVNPDGPELPGPASSLEERFQRELQERHGVRFSSLRVLTNMPIGRFGGALGAGGKQRYLDTLRAAFNPSTVPLLACRRSLTVAWDGRLFDCDFNLGAGLPARGGPRDILEADATLASRRISFGLHCFACTALAGSS